MAPNLSADFLQALFDYLPKHGDLLPIPQGLARYSTLSCHFGEVKLTLRKEFYRELLWVVPLKSHVDLSNSSKPRGPRYETAGVENDFDSLPELSIHHVPPALPANSGEDGCMGFQRTMLTRDWVDSSPLAFIVAL
jgi:hypothetical protein